MLNLFSQGPICGKEKHKNGRVVYLILPLLQSTKTFTLSLRIQSGQESEQKRGIQHLIPRQA